MLGAVPDPRPRRNLEQERARNALNRLAGETDVRALAAAVQQSLGYVAPATHLQIAERAGVGAARVREIVESSTDLRIAPLGAHRVTICTGRTCARRGGVALLRAARRTLEVNVFETSADGAIRLEPFRCLGQCAMAPNVLIDGQIRGAMTGERFGLLLAMLRRVRSR
jgi:formate dehydrogenase subunit gamma